MLENIRHIFEYLDHFLPFYPCYNPKNQHFEKCKKMPGDIILHKCTKNHDHMLYCSWDVVPDGCNYFSFWPIFYSFTLLTAQKMQISKKWKNPWRYYHFTKVYQKSWSYAIPFLRYGAWFIPKIWCMWLFFIWRYFWPFYPPNSPKNQNFEKMKKIPGNIIILHMCTKNYDQMINGSDG